MVGADGARKYLNFYQLQWLKRYLFGVNCQKGLQVNLSKRNVGLHYV